MGLVDIGSRDIVVAGQTILTSALVLQNIASAVIDGDTDVGGALDVTGATTLQAALDVAGAATFSDNLNVEADNKQIKVKSADFDLVYMGNAGSAGANLDRGYLGLYEDGVTKVALQAGGPNLFGGSDSTNVPNGGLSTNNNTGLRGANAANSTTHGLIKLDASDQTSIGDSLNNLVVSFADPSGAVSSLRVTKGAVDSGGSGYRVLRIPNS